MRFGTAEKFGKDDSEFRFGRTMSVSVGLPENLGFGFCPFFFQEDLKINLHKDICEHV